MLSKNKLKQIRKLHRKKGREEFGLTIAEGKKVVCELLSICPALVKEVYVAEGLSIDLTKCEEVNAGQMKEMSLMDTPPGILALVEIPEIKIDLSCEQGVYLYLDGIRDPGNMGTILRTALWFGVTGIICSADCVEWGSPKVVQSSMGAVFRVPVVTGDINLVSDAGIATYGALMNGDNLYQVNFNKPCCLVIGNESNGISNEVAGKLNRFVTIPGSGEMESLNAATATAIILSHMFR